MNRRYAALTVSLCIALSACAGVGPQVFESNRAQYNMALQNTDDQQLLLNIVRLRYRDRPYFLEVSSVASHFNFQSRLGALTALGSPQIEQEVLADAGIVVEEQPTVTYIPLQGADFTQRLLTPVSLQTLVLLAHSGWSIERILKLGAQRINQLPNAPTAAGPTPDAAPIYSDFQNLAERLRELQIADHFFFGCRGGEESEAIYICFDQSVVGSKKYLEIVQLLGLQPGATSFRIVQTATEGKPSIVLQPRSFLGMLYYLSQGVVPPVADVEAGRVTRTRNADNTEFDWLKLMQDLMVVNTAEQRPANAFVAIAYRNRWFYIDDSDLQSKSTFSLLGQIFALTSGSIDGSGPLLTLPIGN